jgi:hypothetical protein
MHDLKRNLAKHLHSKIDPKEKKKNLDIEKSRNPQLLQYAKRNSNSYLTCLYSSDAR